MADKKIIFITGIGTDVGKTIVSAVVVEALEADYWKPIQAGELEFSDSDKIRSLLTNSITKIHKNSFELTSAMSPHAAAAIDRVNIQLDQIKLPNTSNHLVIEGAGGLLVPINNKETVLDLIQTDYKVIVVSRPYLGSINHTLLTIQVLEQRGFEIAGIIYSGVETKSTEEIIEKLSKVPVLGRIDEEESIDRETIRQYANLLRPALENLL
jgi:dethiobiotin synthetase